MPDIFISHSSRDVEIAGQVLSALECAGLPCWIAPRDIGPGEWGAAIIRGLEACRAMVLVFSSASNNSTHVIKEVERAVNKGLVIIPFRMDDASANGNLEYFLSATQWLDGRKPPLDTRIRELVAQVRAVLMPQQPQAACAPPTERLKSVQLHLDHVSGRLLALDGEGRALSWANPLQPPQPLKFPPATEVLRLVGERILTRTILAFDGCQPSGSVDCWRLSPFEQLWTHPFMAATDPSSCVPLVGRRQVAILSGRQHPTIDGLVAPVVKIVDAETGTLRTSIRWDKGGYPFAFVPGEEGMLSWELVASDPDKPSIKHLRLAIRDLDGAEIAIHELQPPPADISGALANGHLLAYQVDGKILVRDLSSNAQPVILVRPDPKAQSGKLLLDGKGRFLLLHQWVAQDCFKGECYDLGVKEFSARIAAISRHAGKGNSWNYPFALEPETGRFLLAMPSDASPDGFNLHLWQMPAGDLVGMNGWAAGRPVSAVFGPDSSCYIGTAAGEVFRLSLPGLQIQKQMA